jgi:hypothetical protein
VEAREPLQNRVLPDGEIVAVRERGLLMGNRGCLHDADRRIGVARWRHRAWISCVLDWQGVHRDVMPPGRWTALFFLDEATALAAGHRPCGYCRREAFGAFAAAWQRAAGLEQPPRAPAMDAALHAERLDPTRRKRTTRVAAGDLPDGAVVLSRSAASGFALVLDGSLRPWSWDGYGPARRVSSDRELDVLTPPSILGALTTGYRPVLHPSARS